MRIENVLCVGLTICLVCSCCPVFKEDRFIFLDSMHISFNHVNQVVLCDMQDSFGSAALHPLSLSIVDKKEIGCLVKEMNSSSPIDQHGYPFVGVFCYQVFLDSASNVLAITHIVNYKSTVEMNQGYYRDGCYYLTERIRDHDRTFKKVFQSKLFVRVIFDHVKKNCPDYLDQRNKECLNLTQKPIVQLLGLE